jgi:hypothetical protein
MVNGFPGCGIAAYFIFLLLFDVRVGVTHVRLSRNVQSEFFVCCDATLKGDRFNPFRPELSAELREC